MTAVYPDGWPTCPSCGEPALDGHITCGDYRCNEGAHRRAVQEQPRCARCGDVLSDDRSICEVCRSTPADEEPIG